MQLNKKLAVAALLAAAASAMAAPRDGLVVRLSAAAPVVKGDVDVSVNVTVTNTSRQPIVLNRWELPTERPEAELFRIQVNGQPVAYTGPLIKRGPATAADTVTIEVGATLSYNVELTAAYDLSRNGTYTIEYAGKGAQESAPLQSDAMYLWLESRTSAPVTADAATGAGVAGLAAGSSVGINAVAAATGSISYTGNCSATRKTQLAQAVTAATTYATGAVNYLAAVPVANKPRYVKWFGTVTAARWSTAKTHYANIKDALVNKPLTLDCSCTQSYYAYVYPTQPYKIYLCNAFWSAPATGTDSKAGTLIHEMSHFAVVAGTQDNAYGQSAAAALAVSNPTNALNNADSHEYFAENNPALQ